MTVQIAGVILKQHHVLRANIAMQTASGMHSAQRSQDILRSFLADQAVLRQRGAWQRSVASTSTLPLQVVPQ